MPAAVRTISLSRTRIVDRCKHGVIARVYVAAKVSMLFYQLFNHPLIPSY